MSSFIMQMAIPSSLANLHYSHTKSSKLSNSISTIGAGVGVGAGARLRLRCSLQTERRSGNYSPSLWDVDSIQSLHSDYKEERHMRRASELIMQVKMMLEKESDPILQLELIDDLQRLGLSDHFQNEFIQILNSIYLDHKYYHNGEMEERDLYSTALAFRLLRQHRFQVAQEVLECFKNEKGEFRSSLRDDTRGLLQLYEASFLSTEGETTLDLARDFATKILQEKLIDVETDENLLLSIRYALEIPIHWRLERGNASMWIDAYKKRADMNPIVLELAILDLNIVQAQYQEELKEDLKWWRNTSIVEKLPFARDRLVECYFWGVGILQPRQHSKARVIMAKTNALITVIDDVYDVYGTLEELEQFTEFIRRWDMSKIDQLPNFMQLSFLALDNFINETAYDVLKEQGFNIIPYLRKSWTDLVEAYLIEARWYYTGYKPTMEEYLESSWRSIGGTVVLTHAFFGVTHDSLTKELIDSFFGYHDLIRWSSIIFRLADDLGTSVDEVSRGDVPKSIQCYMNNYDASEAEARQHVKWIMSETWKKLNSERVSTESPFCKDFIGCAVDVVKMAQYMYHYGDGHGIQHPIIRQQMTTCLFHPFTPSN